MSKTADRAGSKPRARSGAPTLGVTPDLFRGPFGRGFVIKINTRDFDEMDPGTSPG